MPDSKSVELKTNQMKTPSKRGGTDLTTRRFNSNLAIMVRERVPPELLLDFHLAILQGKNPHIMSDDRTTSGWKVTWSEREHDLPSLDQKVNSVNFIRQAGWGLPAQAHYVQQDVNSASSQVDVDFGALANQPIRLAQIARVLRQALEFGQRTVIDVPSVEEMSDNEESDDSEE